MRGIALIALVAGCTFQAGVLPNATDAGIDGPPPITVGFAKATTQTDEEAGTVQVRVILSQAATESVSVAFAVSGGTASRPSDFLLNDGTLTFAPGDVEETIDITIGPDGMDEPNETIELALSNANGAGLGLAAHTLTIDMNTLPRVTFSAATSADPETVATPTINVVLDKPSLLTTSVEVAVMAGSATQGTDYTLATTTITFNPGEVTKVTPLVVSNDTIDEANEDVTLQLVNATNIVIGTTATSAHTINDEDAAPTVAFDVATSGIGEAGPFIDVAVSLSAESGKNFNVPFSVSNTSTAANTDYTIPTASPLAFNAGTTTLNIRVNITQDMLVEGNETVVLTLGNPNPNPNATLGAITTHTLTIRDDDQACLGPESTPFRLCFATPSNTVTINANFNTDSSGMCSMTAPLSGWTGQPSSCFIVAQTINISGNTVVSGSRPLVLFATGNITQSASLDIAAHAAANGPGGGIGCTAYTDVPANNSGGAGGGAGGTFRSLGGNGGTGNGVGSSGGSAVAVGGQPSTLRGGCAGQKGGDGFGGTGENGGNGGGGGGAVYMVAGGTLTINSGVVVNASGGGAVRLTSPDSGLFAGGGGGGSGGMIVLFAQTFSVSGARIMANGGGGSGGADDNTVSNSGTDPDPGAATNPGIGGSQGGSGGNGGNGFGGTSQAQNGENGAATEGGGGGGGGGGFVRSSATLTGANTSAGEIIVQ